MNFRLQLSPILRLLLQQQHRVEGIRPKEKLCPTLRPEFESCSPLSTGPLSPDFVTPSTSHLPSIVPKRFSPSSFQSSALPLVVP
ncbi:hypothetical protein ACTXT7_014027 [Hymenolepis weldensis]